MSVLEKIKNIVAEQLDVAESEVVPEANFVDDLGADSLDLTELIMAMEDEFGLEIDDEEAQNLRTVNDAIKYIESRQAA
ncbi:acyl carrier protein [Desulfovermiculus halophilus]|jgi:acyl carrier protein|uniref:acyl carrier protein n=1 Tax=Desulfovermiculus halophilus TaxID=339722 RepID=UPI000484A1B9|nr:acyl carrier protein [Desulfovermiculus halophilus]